MDIKSKIQILDSYLEKKYHISISKAIEMDEDRFHSLLDDGIQNDEDTLKKIADIFYLDVSVLKDDSLELPHEDSLQIDEVYVSLKQGSYANEVGRKKDKNFLKRNYSALDKGQKKKLWINLSLSALPFLAFVIYSLTSISINRAETLEQYRNGDSLSSEQQKIKDELKQNTQATYAKVKIGSVVENINNISTANSNYEVTMTTRFDFDQMEYHKMWWKMQKGVSFNSNSFYSEEELLMDNYCFNSDNTGALAYSDNIPDVLQFNFENTDGSQKHLKASDGSLEDPTSISTLYLEEVASYPAEKSSNVYADKNDEFSIGNGRIASDSLEYLERGKAYYDETSKSYRYFQKTHYTATINKTFDSPRYPLDSAQFHIYIQPTRNSDYIRYEVDDSFCGYSTYFSISNGYRLLKEQDGIKNLTMKLNYYEDVDRDSPSSTYEKKQIKTQYEIIVRANKVGFTVYLNSFLNIIAVAIWLILAFFNQSFNKEDSLSMIGTGLFSAISAILLGFSMVSNANFFSLQSIINIFTLGMVLLMGYESISCRRSVKMNDVRIVAYRSVRMRILFYFLVGCSLVMYFLLPFLAYIPTI